MHRNPARSDLPDRVTTGRSLGVCLIAFAFLSLTNGCGDIDGPPETTNGTPRHGPRGINSAQIRVDLPDTFAMAGASGAVVRDPAGNFTVVYDQFVYRASIRARRFSSVGKPFSQPFPVMNLATSLGRYPAAGAHDDGSFVVVWRGYTSDPNGDIEARRFTSVGSPIGLSFVVNASTAGQQVNPDVASLGDGRFVVVWSDYGDAAYPDENSLEVFGRIFDANGLPAGGDIHINTFTTSRQNSPRVDAAPNGDFVVVWESGNLSFGGVGGPDGHYLGVSARRFASNGTPMSGEMEFVVNQFTTYSESSPDVAVRADGSFVVVWRTQYGDERPGGPYGVILDDSVTMRVFGSDGVPLTDELHINEFKPGSQVAPAIALNSSNGGDEDDGGFVVVWQSNDNYNVLDPRDSGSGIFGLAFDSLGLQQGAEFHVNSYSTGDQTAPSIASDGKGSFVVVWNGAYARDSGYGYALSYGIAAKVIGETEATPFPITIEVDDDGHLWDNDPLVPYTIRVENIDDAPHSVTLTETVPLRSTFSPANSTAGWNCVPNNSENSICTKELGVVDPAEVVLTQFASSVNPGTPELWTLYNLAFATVAQSAGFAFDQAATPFTICDESDLDPAVCEVVCYFIPAFCVNVRRGPIDETNRYEILHLRDQELVDTRGGQRLTDLYYDSSADIAAATEADPSLIDEGRDVILNFIAPSSARSVGQEQVDALKEFLQALIDVASPELAATLERELARVDLDALVDAEDAGILAIFERLSCEGFEDELFCGEVTGDCIILASDALSILRMSVQLEAALPEADVNGDGTVLAGDALTILRVSVDIEPRPTACNVAR